jgi:hypothetical protein
MTKTFQAYLAGFLDADGSIYVRLKPNSTYKYDFQIAPSVVFFQKDTEKEFMNKLQQKVKLGYLRFRKDGIIEYTIGDRSSIRKIIELTLPYLRLKKKQAQIMLKILDLSKSVTSAQDFLELTKLIDKFGSLNYSKKRVINTQMVRHHLQQKGLLTP